MARRPGGAAGDLPTLPVELVVPRWLALGQAGTSQCISVMRKNTKKMPLKTISYGIQLGILSFCSLGPKPRLTVILHGKRRLS